MFNPPFSPVPSDWLWLFDSDQVYCSPALAALLGQAPKLFPVAYQTYLNWVHPEDRAYFHETLYQARENQQAFFLEHRCQWGEGRIRYLEACGEPLYTETGEIIGLRSHYRNISDRWLTESLLKEAEANLRQALETMPDAALIINPLGGIVYLNQHAESLFGHARPSLLGKPLESLIAAHELVDFQNFWQAFRRLPETAQMRSKIEICFESQSQGRFPAELVLGATSFKGPGNCMAIIRDISAFKQIENEIRSLNRDLEARVKERTLAIQQAHQELAQAHHFSLQVVDALPSHLCVLNPEGKIMLLNAGWQKLGSFNVLQDHRYGLGTDYLQRCLQGENQDPISHTVGKNLALLLKNQIPGFQQEYPCEVGTQTHWFLLSARPFQLAGQTHAVIAHQEITALKETEIQLEKMRQQAESANRAKSSFLANMSHEIRTPLNAILGFSQLLQKGLSPDSEQAPYLAEIQSSGQHLLKLINQLLEIAQSETKQLELQPDFFSLHKLLFELRDAFQPLAQQKQLGFFCHFPETDRQIYTDRAKLQQLLSHLLSNAIQFTAQGEVTFEVYFASQAKTYLHFSISDTGLGIAPLLQERIFLPFTESEVGLKAPHTTGLGLAICKQYSLLMGGQLALQSQLEQGTTFSLSLPLPDKLAPLAEAIDNATESETVAFSLPSQMLTQVEEAILLGEVEMLKTLLATAQPPKLAEKLLHLAEHYQFEELLNALK